MDFSFCTKASTGPKLQNTPTLVSNKTIFSMRSQLKELKVPPAPGPAQAKTCLFYE